MNLKKYMTMLAAVLCLAACSDDEEAVKPAMEVAGTYSGYTIASCNYFQNSVTAKQTVSVVAVDDVTADVTYQSDSWGSFKISGATVTVAGDSYSISGNGTTTMGMGGNVKDYDCTLTATVKSGKVEPSFKFNVAGVMGGLNIEFVEGEAPAELLLAGSYSGYTKAVAQYFPNGMYADDETVKLTANADKTLKLEYTSSKWGSFVIDNLTPALANDVYTLKGDGTCTMGMSEESMKTYDCSLEASIDINKENPSFVFCVPAVMGGLTITFAPGDAPEAE